MDSATGWQVITDTRLRLADLLAQLDPPDWDRPTLCAGWRVRDVAAHVAMAPQPPGLGSMLADAARARGSFHRLNHDLAVRYADRRSAADLVADLRHHAASRRLPVVTNYRNILFDVLVHGQDIAVPLHRDLAVPPDAAVAGATRVWTMGWPFWARRRLRGVHLVATDAEWSAGRGADVRGPIGALLLLLTGRTGAAVPRLDGPGVPHLTGAGR
ncbi:MAG TPA: maleylpyruvate isomerase family mycothiol-dependent enzyme [Actinoplanes sp.]|nr:maleylpyruvate isomerase family mycothiol-dependent enzyme [Actinoplanes sp.]